MTWVQWIPLFASLLVAMGAGVMVGAYYMGRQARRAVTLMDNLLLQAQAHEDDPLTFVPNSLQVLEQAGLAYGKVRLRWFGQVTVFEVGGARLAGEPECDTWVVGQGDIEAQIVLCPQKGLRGEQHVLYSMIQRLWMRLLSSQINGRLAQLHLAEQQLRRYELFYKHDLKNLAQFMNLLSAQLKQCETADKALELVTRLKKLLPALEQRADRILKHLDHKQQSGWQAVEVVSLADIVRMVATSMDLPVAVDGDSQVPIVVRPMEQGLQNVLENFRDHLGLGEVLVSIRSDEHGVRMVLTSLRMLGGLDDRKKARMFEPFWTTSESGMGLGLYIARQSIQAACGGTLDAILLDAETGQWGFEIRCPHLQMA